MGESSQETYLGDRIHKSGKLKHTIDARVARGYGAITTILAIINEIPLAHWRVQAGLQLRQAMFLNTILVNSEAWHDITDMEIEQLEKVDEALLRGIINAHAKVPIEALFLETGSIPIRFIIKSRRFNFLKNILKREDEELIKEVFNAQKESPIDGDFYKLVTSDLEKVNLTISENDICNTNKEALKKTVKIKVRKAAFEELIKAKNNHSKMSGTTYKSLELQNYMKSPLFDNESVTMLFALKTRTVRGIKNDFRGMFNDNQCPLGCGKYDTLQNVLVCPVLNSHMKSNNIARTKAKYEDIFSEDILKQKEITPLYNQLMYIREELMKNQPA